MHKFFSSPQFIVGFTATIILLIFSTFLDVVFGMGTLPSAVFGAWGTYLFVKSTFRNKVSILFTEE